MYTHAHLKHKLKHTHTHTHTHTNTRADCYYNVFWGETGSNFRHVNQKGQNANVSFSVLLSVLIILSGSKSLHQKRSRSDKGRPELTDKLNLRLLLTLSSLYLAYLHSSHTHGDGVTSK